MSTEKHCFIQVDLDDKQWVHPRQQNAPYNISRSDLFLKAWRNMLEWLGTFPLTLFVVGWDARVREKSSAILKFLKDSPRVEIANHSLSHLNDFDRLSLREKEEEILGAEEIFRDVFPDHEVRGFRAPGYVVAPDVLDILRNNNYLYDASLLPSFIGPLLRYLNYYINGVPGKGNFGHFLNGVLPNEPVLLDTAKKFFEVNVSVCPGTRMPIHYSLIPHRYLYKILTPMVSRVRFLSFTFHLYDFLDIDVPKMRCVLKMLTSERRLGLTRDVALYCSS
jgi:hypothetical protein